MTRRAFKQSVVNMPQFCLNNIAVVLLFYFGLLTVRADLKGQPDLKLTQVTINEPAAQHPIILCECEFFVQSWKTSHMIRLPMGTYYNLSLCHQRSNTVEVFLCFKPDNNHFHMLRKSF